MPDTCRFVIPEYVPDNLAFGTVPNAKLDAFKLVKFEPIPK